MHEIDRDSGLNDVFDLSVLGEKLKIVEKSLEKMEKGEFGQRLDEIYRADKNYLRLMDDVGDGYETSSSGDEDDELEDEYFEEEKELEGLKIKLVEECGDEEFKKMFKHHELLERYKEDIEKRMGEVK